MTEYYSLIMNINLIMTENYLLFANFASFYFEYITLILIHYILHILYIINMCLIYCQASSQQRKYLSTVSVRKVFYY